MRSKPLKKLALTTLLTTTLMASSTLNSTTTLLARFRDGNLAARDELVQRYLPVLKRWARGRLPSFGRDLAETDDLVQVTFLRALNNLEGFTPERPGAFLAYLRTILLNNVREELRRSGRKPPTDELTEVVAGTESVVEQAIGSELLDEYQKALELLNDNEQQAVILRIEFGMSYSEVALELGDRSANAARMLISRALTKMAQAMPRDVQES